MKRSQEARWGDVGWGRDDILGASLSLFSHCPLMIGFLFAFFLPLVLHSLIFSCFVVKALFHFSFVISWLDLRLCCLSQFVHSVWQQKGEREDFLASASNSPPGSYFYEWGCDWSSLVTYFRLDWTCDTHETFLYFRRVFSPESPFSFSDDGNLKKTAEQFPQRQFNLKAWWLNVKELDPRFKPLSNWGPGKSQGEVAITKQSEVFNWWKGGQVIIWFYQLCYDHWT